jgi:hypothetical protein
MNAESRKQALLTQDVGNELVIYDERDHRAHRLSSTAAIVWRLADGTRGVPELAVSLRESTRATDEDTATTIDQTSGEKLVRLALKELDRTGLLERRLPNLGEPLSRREWIGAAAALLPVITSILAPTPAMAQTIPGGLFGEFAGFNGTYTGTGTPTAFNPCGINAGPVTITLALLASGAGTVTIRHAGGQTFMHNCTIQSRTPSAGTPTSFVLNIADTTGSGFTSQADLTFQRNANGTYSVSGHQDLGNNSCGESTYNLAAGKASS